MYGPQQIILASKIGDIFWDLPSYITYIEVTQLGVTIYVANPSDTDREYSLMARLVGADGKEILEEAITVFGFTWFPVEAGQFVKIHAELAYEQSNVILNVMLVERSTGTEVDSVTTYLIRPSAAQLPPFPGGAGITTDWMNMLMLIMVMGMVGSMVKGKETGEEKKVREAKELKERKALASEVAAALRQGGQYGTY